MIHQSDYILNLWYYELIDEKSEWRYCQVQVHRTCSFYAFIFRILIIEKITKVTEAIFVISIGIYKTEKNEYRRNKFSSLRFAIMRFFSPFSIYSFFLLFARICTHLYLYVFVHKWSWWMYMNSCTLKRVLFMIQVPRRLQGHSW